MFDCKFTDERVQMAILGLHSPACAEGDLPIFTKERIYPYKRGRKLCVSPISDASREKKMTS
eukprot:3654463-Amphidinium_carterae.1